MLRWPQIKGQDLMRIQGHTLTFSHLTRGNIPNIYIYIYTIIFIAFYVSIPLFTYIYTIIYIINLSCSRNFKWTFAWIFSIHLFGRCIFEVDSEGSFIHSIQIHGVGTGSCVESMVRYTPSSFQSLLNAFGGWPGEGKVSVTFFFLVSMTIRIIECKFFFGEDWMKFWFILSNSLCPMTAESSI